MTSGFLLSLSQPTTGLQGMLPIGVKHPLGRFRGCPVRSRLAKKYIFWSVSHVQADAASLRSSSLHNIRDGIDEKQQTNEHQQIDERFRSVLHEVETIKSKYVVEEALKWYKKHIRLPRFCFYLSGILIIILSVSLPYLATLEGLWRTIVLPIVALVVAGLTGLSSFFKWDTTMRSHIQAKFQLQFWLSIWELQITEAKHELDVERAIEKALQATQQLLENAQTTLSTEVEEHYKSIKPPSAAFLIGDNNRDGLVEPNRLIFNSSANEERSTSATLLLRDCVLF